VQVYYNNTWGWICGQRFEKQDADVVCKELGYIRSSVIYNGLVNVQGNSSLWIDNLRCTGNESSLVSCAHGGWTNESCAVNQIAGVACTGPEGIRWSLSK